MDSVLRAAAVYLLLVILTRITGRRSLSQVTVFDFVLLLIVAETTQQALLGDDLSLTNAAIVMTTLFGIDVFLSFAKQWSPMLGIWVDGNATVLVSQGQPDREALVRSRVGLDDVLEAARLQHGLKRLDQIDMAVLEVSGGISIVPAEKAAPS